MTNVFTGPDRRVLVVVPALNEAASVGSVVTEIRASNPDVDVLVVDDGSTDETAEVARTPAPGCAACRSTWASAVRCASATASRSATATTTVVQIDADGQHDPSTFPPCSARSTTADVVIGARFAGEGDYRVGGPRRWAMVVLARRAQPRLAHEPLTDVTRATAPPTGAPIALFAEHYPSEYLGDTVESLVIAVRAGCRVQQVPVSMRPRQPVTPVRVRSARRSTSRAP